MHFKNPLLISGIIVQSMLDNMSSFYSNFIETRIMLSGRKLYYLNSEFLKQWKKNRRELLPYIDESDLKSKSAKIEFYGFSDSLLSKRYADIDIEFDSAVAQLKAGKEVHGDSDARIMQLLQMKAVTDRNTDSSLSGFEDSLIPYDDAVAEFMKGIIAKINPSKIDELAAILKKNTIGLTFND